MNRMTISLVVAGLILIAVFLLGRLILVGPIETRLIEETLRQQETADELARVKTEHDTLKASLASAPSLLPRHWLGMGEEAGLLRGLFDAASGSQILVRKFEFLKIFHLKGENQEGAGTPTSQGSEELPQFDERTGQAMGAQTDEGETEWPGIEILPVRVELKGMFVGIVGFFLQARKTLPRFQVRSLDLGIDESGIVKGKAILVFPLLEKSVSAGSTAGE